MRPHLARADARFTDTGDLVRLVDHAGRDDEDGNRPEGRRDRDRDQERGGGGARPTWQRGARGQVLNAARFPASSSSHPNSWMPCPLCALSQGLVSGRRERSRTAYQVPALRTSQPR